jgi:hypothetical protein
VFVVLVDCDGSSSAFANRSEAQSEAMSLDADPIRPGRVRVLGFEPTTSLGVLLDRLA